VGEAEDIAALFDVVLNDARAAVRADRSQGVDRALELSKVCILPAA
jgi:hypothetical protein